MTARRLGAAACLAVLGGGLTACSAGDGVLKPSADGYLELACSIHDHQRDLPFDKVNEDDAEEQLAYAASTALLEVGNRKLDKDLQDLSNELKVALDRDNAKAFDDASGKLGDTCEDVDHDLSMEPEDLAGSACAIADVLEPGPGPQVLLTSELLNAAASDEDGLGKYELLAAAAARLVINPSDPLDPAYPSEAAIEDFQQECASFD